MSRRSGYGKKQAARDTGSSTKSVSRAWHAARDHATSSGELSNRNRHKTSDSREGGVLYGIFKALGMTK